MNYINKMDFDWHKEKKTNIVGRGNMALVAYALDKNKQMTNPSSTRCVWPSSIATTEDKYISRRLWNRA